MDVFKVGNYTCGETLLGGMLMYILLLSNSNHSQVLTLDNNLENERSFDASLTKTSKGSSSSYKGVSKIK
jgi:hypothetical protein